MTTDHTRDALATATVHNAGIVHALLAIADALDGGPYTPDAGKTMTTVVDPDTVTAGPFAAITVDHDVDPEPEPEFCTSHTRSDPTPDGKQALVSCNRVANHAGLHMDGSWVWSGEPGHEYALTNLDSGGDVRDLPDVVRHMSPADANTVVANMTATPHIDARDPKRAERLDHTSPVWRLRALAGNVRRAMSLEPLPIEMTVDQLLDDLETNVDELIDSRDNWRSEAEHLGRRS